jgi:Xaa-Pro aminopeptidase
MRRISALKKVAFEEAGFDGYLIFNSSNLFYFTGVQGASALLIPRNGESTVYAYGVNFEQTRATAKGFNVDLVKRGEDLMVKIARQACEHGIKKLAVDALGVEGWHNLSKQLRGKSKLAIKPSFVSELRIVKDEKEIELMCKAAELTSLGMNMAYECIRTGIKEVELAAEIEYAMRKRGSYGTAFDTAVSSGPASAFPHGGCTDRKIREGDLIVVDIGAVYKNYRSDMTRTLVSGKLSEKQQKIHKIVKQAYDKAFAAIKPGAKAKDVDAAGRQIIEKAGYGEFFVHGLGHGVGLDIHEPPTLNPSSKEKLQVGNVVTDEPGIYLVGYGGVRIEDSVLVTAEGAEKLTIGPLGLCKES